MCKFEKYGSCDEESRNQEYCIFHKPEKNGGEAKEFYEKFLERFKPRREKVEVEGEEFERLIFEDEVDCSGFVFPEIPENYLFVFKKDAWFSEATFEGNAWFDGATFEGNAWFWEATFKKDAWFDGATFEGFAWFREATFKGYAVFSKATFEGNAAFSKATFEGDAWFKEVTFKGKADFVGARFEGLVTFEGKEYEEKDEEEKYMFYGELDFSNAEFSKGISIYDPIKRGLFRLPQAMAEACRVQRLSYEREGRRDEADRMFVIERRSLRKAKVDGARAEVKKAWGKVNVKGKAKLKSVIRLTKAVFELIKAYGSSFIEWIVADLTCEYGTNWKRPVVLWVFTVLFFFPLLYLISGGVEIHSSAFDFFYFSIVTATTLGYGDLHPIGTGKALASAEAIFGTFMWAVFLAVFSRKYMR